MSDDRNRPPRRPGAGRRTPYIAGHRVRDRAGDAPDAPEATDGAAPVTHEETDTSTASAPQPVEQVGDDAPAGAGDFTEDDARRADSPADGAGEPADAPQQIRVADTGWPERLPTADALPRREPGATGGPGGVTAPITPDASRASEAVPAVSDVPPTADARAGLTSPPYDQEPWAGLPAPSGPRDSDAAAAGPSAPEVAGAGVDAGPADAGAVVTSALPSPTAADVAATAPADTDASPAGETVAAAVGDAVATAPLADEVLPGRPSHRRPSRRRRRTAASAPAAARLVDETATDQPADVVPVSAPTRWARLREPALVVALLAALTLGGLDIWTHFVRPPTNQLTSAGAKRAATAATAVAVPILSYDYRTIDQQVAKIRPLTTATCSTQYANVIKKVVKPLAVQNQAVMQAQVLETGVRTASASRVTVLVFAQLTSSNKASAAKKINAVQLTLTMVQTHGRWLLSGTSANGSGSSSAASC